MQSATLTGPRSVDQTPHGSAQQELATAAAQKVELAKARLSELEASRDALRQTHAVFQAGPADLWEPLKASVSGASVGRASVGAMGPRGPELWGVAPASAQPALFDARRSQALAAVPSGGRRLCSERSPRTTPCTELGYSEFDNRHEYVGPRNDQYPEALEQCRGRIHEGVGP